MSASKKKAPLAWRQDGARPRNLEPKLDGAAHSCKRLRQALLIKCPAKSPSHQAYAIVSAPRSMVRGFFELSLSIGPVKFAFHPRLFSGKLKREANRLVFDVQSSAAGKARIYCPAATIGKDE
jgi:hypothetical protein